METMPTPNAVAIFAAVQRGTQDSVFLCEQNSRPVLSFGANRTKVVRYWIHLRWREREIQLRSRDHKQVAFLLDRGGPERTLRLVLYDGVNPLPIIDSCGKDGSLSGQILIQAHAEQGDGEAVLHAIFAASGESSLVIDSDQELTRHLTLEASMLEGGAVDGLF